MDAIVNETKSTKTKIVSLKKLVQVHITYFTAWPTQSGQVQFRPDIYGHNKQVWKALKKQGPAIRPDFKPGFLNRI